MQYDNTIDVSKLNNAFLQQMLESMKKARDKINLEISIVEMELVDRGVIAPRGGCVGDKCIIEE